MQWTSLKPNENERVDLEWCSKIEIVPLIRNLPIQQFLVSIYLLPFGVYIIIGIHNNWGSLSSSMGAFSLAAVASQQQQAAGLLQRLLWLPEQCHGEQRRGRRRGGVT